MDELLLGGLQDVVVLRVVADRLEARVAFPVRRLVGVLEEEELELRGDVDAVAELRRALDLPLEDAARRRLDGPVVLVLEVAEDERRLLEPRDRPERRPVGHGMEVLVAGRPARHAVSRERRHVDVDREEIGAGVHPVARHLVQEEAPGDAFSHEPALLVGERDQDRVDLTAADELLEAVERQGTGHGAS